MANNRMVRGALGMINSSSNAEEPKLGKLGKLPKLVDEPEREKPSIEADPEAQDALRTLKEKGYTSEDIAHELDSGLDSGLDDSGEDEPLDEMKAGIGEGLSKHIKSVMGRR